MKFDIDNTSVLKSNKPILFKYLGAKRSGLCFFIARPEAKIKILAYLPDAGVIYKKIFEVISIKTRTNFGLDTEQRSRLKQ